MSDPIRAHLDKRPNEDRGFENRMFEYEDALRAVLDLCDVADAMTVPVRTNLIRYEIAKHLGVEP